MGGKLPRAGVKITPGGQAAKGGKINCYTGPEVMKLFSCSTQLSMKFVLLINLKFLTIPNSFLLNIAEHEIFSANKYENANYFS